MTSSPANDNSGEKTPACPICGRPRMAEHRPFCSRRCADVDLHHWLSAAYVISGREPVEDEESHLGQLFQRPTESGAKN